jgi:hypothetical protein
MSGTVVKITPERVDVQCGAMQKDGSWNPHELLHFDANGKGIREGPHDNGPWELIDDEAHRSCPSAE